MNGEGVGRACRSSSPILDPGFRAGYANAADKRPGGQGRTCRSRSPWDDNRQVFVTLKTGITKRSKLVSRDRMDPSSYGNGTERRGPSKGMANYSPPSAYEISTYQVLNKPTCQ